MTKDGPMSFFKEKYVALHGKEMLSLAIVPASSYWVIHLRLIM